jgi:hypothetical protein
MWTRSTAARVLAALGVFATVGCFHGPIADADATVDCEDACDRYRDCYDDDFDVMTCRSRCRSARERDPRSTHECEACLDGRTCAKSLECLSGCRGILP